MSPVRTAIVDDHQIDLAGVSAVLARFGDRIRLVALGDGPGPDVILYGVRETHGGHDAVLHHVIRQHDATVIVLGWGSSAEQVEWALACGAHGHLSKTMSGEQLVAGLERIHRRRDQASGLPVAGRCHPEVDLAGLTPRELEVLTMITSGMTNQEIADRAYISINSVKTYVRTAYRKIGVSRRSQAVSWGVQHGLDVAHVLDAPLSTPA